VIIESNINGGNTRVKRRESDKALDIYLYFKNFSKFNSFDFSIEICKK